MRRRTEILGPAAALVALIATGVGFNALYNQSVDEKKPLSSPWSKDHLTQPFPTVHTTFIQDQPFSKGANVHKADTPPAYFPFNVTIPNGAVSKFRDAISDILPRNVELEIHAAEINKLDTTPDASKTRLALAVSFDALVIKEVYPEFKNRVLVNDEIQEYFAKAVERKILSWILTGIYTNLSKTGQPMDSDTISAKVAAKVVYIQSPIHVEPDSAVDYEYHYQQTASALGLQVR